MYDTYINFFIQKGDVRKSQQLHHCNMLNIVKNMDAFTLCQLILRYTQNDRQKESKI